MAASKFLRLVDQQSKFHLFKKSIKELPKAGAAITCGVNSLQGLSRRPVTDDHPTLAMLTATCLKLAAEDTQKLDLRIPHLKLAGLVWKPSGLFSTAEAIRNRQELKLDAAPLRSKRRTKDKREGPCVFGCLPKATLSQNGSIQWYAVPDPSPWHGISPGETLCKKCYSWSRAGIAKRKRQSRTFPSRNEPLSIGSTIVIQNLVSRPELNGEAATISVPKNDDDRIVVELQNGELIRILMECVSCADVYGARAYIVID